MLVAIIGDIRVEQYQNEGLSFIQGRLLFH